MAEPTSGGAAAGAAAWKAIGGAAGVAAGGAGLAAIVVMLMSQPRSPREWAVALISTVVCSVAGGAYVMHWLGMADLAGQGPTGLMVLLGSCFACGLPGWVLVRALFRWLDKRAGHDLGELARDAADDMRSVLEREDAQRGGQA